MAVAKPPIDDQYWFDYSKELIEKGSSGRDAAALKLQNLIVWFWGIYTASAAVGIALTKSSYSWPILLFIASPSAILVLAYWATVWAQMPVSPRFYPEIAESIRDAYEKGIRIKNRRLNTAILLSLIAAILVGFSLACASLGKQATSPEFNAYYKAKEGHNIVTLSGYHFPAKAKISLMVTPFQKSVKVSPKELFCSTSQSGDLQANIELDSAADKCETSVEWKAEDGFIHSLKQTILPESDK